MKRQTALVLAVLLCLSAITSTGQTPSPADDLKLPGRYFKLLEESITRINAKLAADPEPTLASLEGGRLFAHFPHAVLIPAVLYAKKHPLNKHSGERSMLLLAERIGDFLVKENQNGHYRAKSRNDSDWDTYMWLEAYRLLKNKLGEERGRQWAAAILENLQLLEAPLEKYQDYPWYNAPFIITSPNHYSIYASTLLVGGYVFHKPEWIRLASKVLHRFCVQEQTADGYWGEHSQAGPTTGYDYVTFTQISLYYEYSKDPEALKALRRSTDFHSFFTYPDGTPVETINDRNRYWGVSMWGHFGFSHFEDGRRYAEFLSGFFPLHGDTASYGGDIQSLGRIAQDLIYYHEGPVGKIPQDKPAYAHRMKVEAGIRKTGPWVLTYSGIIAPPVTLNNFFLDRQGNFSVFNKKTGLIFTGANSKRQPELATFTEVIGADSIHMPVESRLEMNEGEDKLSLAYNVFFASLEFAKPTEKKLSFRIRTHYKWGEAVSGFNLQLMLTSGQEIETGTGKKIILGTDPISWDNAETGGILKHHGWVLHLPPGVRFEWPVYPFNPYRDMPETDLSKAIGRLSLPLELKDQTIAFEIDVD